MKLLTQKRAARLLALTGLFAIGAGVMMTRTVSANMSTLRAMQVADGSESTGKPPKPHHRLAPVAGPALIADSGSESTGKPPKSHLA